MVATVWRRDIGNRVVVDDISRFETVFYAGSVDKRRTKAQVVERLRRSVKLVCQMTKPPSIAMISPVALSIIGMPLEPS